MSDLDSTEPTFHFGHLGIGTDHFSCVPKSQVSVIHEAGQSEEPVPQDSIYIIQVGTGWSMFDRNFLWKTGI